MPQNETVVTNGNGQVMPGVVVPSAPPLPAASDKDMVLAALKARGLLAGSDMQPQSAPPDTSDREMVRQALAARGLLADSEKPVVAPNVPNVPANAPQTGQSAPTPPAAAPTISAQVPIKSDQGPMVPQDSYEARTNAVNQAINGYNAQAKTKGVSNPDIAHVADLMNRYVSWVGANDHADNPQFQKFLQDNRAHGWQIIDPPKKGAGTGTGYFLNENGPAGIVGDLEALADTAKQTPDMLLNLTGNDPRQYMQPTQAQGDALALDSQKQAALQNVPGTVKDLAAGVPVSQIGKNYADEAANHPLLFGLNAASVLAPALHGAGAVAGMVGDAGDVLKGADINPTPGQVTEYQSPELHPTAPGENGAARATDGKFVPVPSTPPVPTVRPAKPSPRQMPRMALPGQDAVPPAPAPAGKPGVKLDANAASMLGLGAISPHVEAMTDAVAQHIGQIAEGAKDLAGQAAAHTQGGRYRTSYTFSKAVGDALNKTAASSETAQTYATLQDRYVHQGLTPEQRDLLGRYYLDQRAQGLEAQGNTAHNVPKLTPAEQQQVAADPVIQQAISRYEQNPGQFLHDARKFVSPRMKATMTPDGHFASLVPLDTVPSSGRGGGSSLAGQQRMKGSRFAQQATGGAKAGYESDLGKNLRVTVPEVVQKANQRQLYKTVLAQKDAQGNSLGYTNVGGKTLPKEITWNGKVYPASPPLEIATRAIPGPKLANGSTGAPRLQKVQMVVPQPMYADLLDATTRVPKVSSGLDVANKFGAVATSISLTSPAEILYHANRVLSLAKAVPGMTSGAPVAGRLQALGKLINLDMSAPENVAALQRLMEANGGSSRPFSHHLEQGGINNPLGQFNHGTLFGLPAGKGVKQLVGGNFGLDLRLRVAAENIRAKVEGNTDPQRVRDFANQFGQYTSVPDPLIEQARKVHPFAATSLPMRVTEVRQLVGGTGMKGLPPAVAAKVRAQSLASGVGGTMLGLAVANYAMSGHWPWENAPGHEFDIEAGKDKDGEPVYVPGSVIAPTVVRPLHSLGVTDMVEQARTPASAGQRLDQAGTAIGRGAANTFLEETNSPLAGAALAATTGKAPYITKGNTLLQIAPQAQEGQSQALLNLMAGAGSVLPVGRATGAVNNFSGGIQSPTLKALAAAGLIRKKAGKSVSGGSGGLSGGLSRGLGGSLGGKL